MLERDLRHLGEVLVQVLGQRFRLQVFRSLREALDVTEEDGELLAPRGDPGIVVAGENGLMDLRRQVFGELCGQVLQRGLALVEFARLRLQVLVQLDQPLLLPVRVPRQVFVLAHDLREALEQPLRERAHLGIVAALEQRRPLGQQALFPVIQVEQRVVHRRVRPASRQSRDPGSGL